MSCSPSSLAKYKSRPGPPIPATLCTLGEIKLGNNGNKYQIVEVNSRSGLTHKWQKCGTGSTNCKLVKSKKPLVVDKTTNYTLQLKLTLSQHSVTPLASKSKTFLNSKIKSIMNSLLDIHNQDDFIININDGYATILYTFHYTKKQLDKNRIYYNEDVRDDDGNLELDEDDFIRTIYEGKLVNDQLKEVKKHDGWFIYNYWDDIKLIDAIKMPKPKAKPKASPKANAKYSSMAEWRKISPLGKKFNKMILKANKGSKWDYKLAEQYNLEEKRMEKKFDKPVKVKKLTKSEALKIHDEIYKVWDKVSKKSMKLHGYKEYFTPNPQFHNISKAKSFKHNIKTTNDNGFSLDCACGPNTGDKYLYYESCISKSLPKKECNKYIRMLNKDLTNIQKSLELSTKKTKKMVVKKTQVKPKKGSGSEALKHRNEVYKTWDKLAKKSKKSSVKSKKKCPTGKVVNPKTGRCINALKKIDTLLTKANSKLSKAMSTKRTPIVWDVKKDGVMLAHTFKDPKTGKIKNPPKGFPKAPIGWYVSEKYDGYRAIWNGRQFVSRTGNIFVTPQWFKDWFPNDEALDGELFIGRESFEKHGILRKKVANDDEWIKANIKFQIFDSPTIKGDFEERQTKIKKIIDTGCKKKGVKKCPLKYTIQTKIKNESQLYSIFDKLTKKGAEGVMLRAPHSPYETKRSSHLLKVKQLFDDECKIIGFKNGSGKYTGMLGAFKCKMVKNPKIEFTISGMNDIIRKDYLKTHPIGTIVTFTYMGLSVNGVPRHPNYLRKYRN